MNTKVKVASIVALCGALLGGLLLVNTIQVHVAVQQKQDTEKAAQADRDHAAKMVRTIFSGATPNPKERDKP